MFRDQAQCPSSNADHDTLHDQVPAPTPTDIGKDVMGNNFQEETTEFKSVTRPSEKVSSDGDRKSEPCGADFGEILPTKTSESEPGSSRTNISDVGIEEYTRHNMELWRIFVAPKSSLPAFGNFPSLENLPSLGQKERQAILIEAVGLTTDFVNKFDPSLQLYFMCLVFWVRNAIPHVSHHILKGIILSAFLLHVHKEILDRENHAIKLCAAEHGRQNDKSLGESGDKMDTKCDAKVSGSRNEDLSQTSVTECGTAHLSKTKEQLPLSITNICRSETNKVLTKVRDNLGKYYHNPVHMSSKNLPVPEIFHGSAQFQACLLDIIHLNRLLCDPFPVPELSVLFNGSFIYTIVHELQARSNPDLFLSEMLVKSSTLIVLFKSLCSDVAEEVGDNVFAEQKVKGKKCCKGAKKRKKKQELSSSGKQMAAEDVGSEDGQAGQRLAYLDLNNRFGLLLMEDDS